MYKCSVIYLYAVITTKTLEDDSVFGIRYYTGLCKYPPAKRATTYKTAKHTYHNNNISYICYVSVSYQAVIYLPGNTTVTAPTFDNIHRDHK